MDEILRKPRSEHPLPKPEAGKKPSGLIPALEDAAVLTGRQAGRVLHRAEDVLSKLKFGRAPFLVLSLLTGLFFVLTTLYSPSYIVTVDGVELGVIHEKTEFEGAVDRVAARASQILGYNYLLEPAVEYTFALTEKDQFPPVSNFENYLFDQIGEVMKTYVLRVNGQIMGASVNQADLTEILDRISAPYLTENTTSHSFVEDVEITHEYTAADIVQDMDAVYAALTVNTNGETTYEVVQGDTFMAIAYRNDMSMSELEALNPGVTPEMLMIGQLINVREIIPFLSVSTVENITYTEEVPCPVEDQEDPDMYTGDTKILVQGVPGQNEVNADVIYVNGVERERTVLSTVVLSEPTTTVRAVGTKERPKTMPTGSFAWPVSGRITSNFGYRYIFGSTSYHSGLDIAVPYGTSIRAADGGTVTFAGYKGSYGNLVTISHGNGMVTYYGHNSQLLVSAGDKVYKGQVIAKAGSTGRSTGSHCHFEVRINGTAVNPRAYLP
ncbi:MAG: M23 family metallopeptidase [Oscillospiraceae bacterium]|nr:M23 family metallopeptidase [Oscillospiraceae bacterium]